MKHRFQESVNTFKCDLCEEVFNCDDVLDSHKAAGCPKQFVCQVCHVDCLDLNERWKHEFEVHPDSDQLLGLHICEYLCITMICKVTYRPVWPAVSAPSKRTKMFVLLCVFTDVTLIKMTYLLILTLQTKSRFEFSF